MDFGEEAFLKTIDILDEEGVRYFGAGNYRKDNFQIQVIIDFMEKIGFFGSVC